MEKYKFVGSTNTVNFFGKGNLVQIDLDEFNEAAEYLGYQEDDGQTIEKIVEKVVYRDPPAQAVDEYGFKKGDDIFEWADKFGRAVASDNLTGNLFDRAKELIHEDYKSSKSQILLAAIAYYSRNSSMTDRDFVIRFSLLKIHAPTNVSPMAYYTSRISSLRRTFAAWKQPSSLDGKNVRKYMEEFGIRKWSDYGWDIASMAANIEMKIRKGEL